MSANWGLQLIASVIRDPESPSMYDQAKELGVRTDMFGGAEARAVWSGIEFHYNRPEIFGHVPSEALLKEKYTSLDLPDPQENFEDLCRLVKTRYLRRRTDSAIESYTSDAGANPEVALADLFSALGAIQEQGLGNTDKNFKELALRETLDELSALEATSGLMGMPFPWQRLNVATGGISPGDFIIAYALPKSMKTWIGLLIATNLAITGRKVLIYSKEMMWDTLRRRIACLVSKVNYGKYRKNELTQAEKHKVLEALDWFETRCEGEIVFTTADRADGSPGGPAEIRRKVEMYSPHFVLLDSAYMLELPNNSGNAYDWKAMSMVNRQIKQVAKSTGIPILAILQENERAAYKYKGTRGTASLAMNTSAIMDCDLTIRIVYNREKEELSLHLPASRETKDEGFTIHACACENFGYAHDKLWEVGDGADEEDAPRAEENTYVQSALESLSTDFVGGESPIDAFAAVGDLEDDLGDE
jgi:hypothetical protein